MNNENRTTFTHAILDAKIKISNASPLFFCYIHHIIYTLDILVDYLEKKLQLQADSQLILLYSNG
jgi:hypothetical protein